MNKIRVSLSLLSAAIAIPGLAAAADISNAKLLSGPPSEFASMAPAKAESSLQTSKSAMIPITLRDDGRGNLSWEGSIAVEAEQLRMALLNGGAGDWTMDLRAPFAFGASSPARSIATRVEQTSYGIDGASQPAEYYAFDGLSRGNWSVSIRASGRSASQRGFLLVEGGATRLLTAQTDFNQTVGQQIGLTAKVAQADEFGAINATSARISSVNMSVTAPDGRQFTQAFYDDGLHSDGRARDGIYGGSFSAQMAGDYTVQISMAGQSADGTSFYRTAEHLIPVVSADLSFARAAVSTAVVDDSRLAIRVPMNSGRANDTRHFRVHAEVWGADRSGRMAPVAWVGGMKQINGGQLELSLDGRWLSLAGVNSATMELRNLRIEDPDHFIAVAKSQRLPFTAARLPTSAGRAAAGITEDMRMGPRPQAALEAGSRLLLVHGYCSGNVWGPQTGQFTGESVFQDLNQNRSHDEFARRVRDYGASWSSFGIVAHSQGGAAATHLYTYYWSGLDYASGNRLIQSVGTPYQGTNLAGNLAVLGQIFGAGCGSNSNLTYSGAASWLSGIPSWARAKVNYSTTSFNDRWWAYDYCHIATDLLLNDPDDGTTERAYGQLSGAVNRGHKTGWCHTSGMRDPAQTTDASRNADMNNNAAR